MAISYQLDAPYSIDNINDYPAYIRPLIELEAKAPCSWYINAIAAKEEFRRQGIAKKLLDEAEYKAKRQSILTMSIIVASENIGAKNLYLSFGYKHITSVPVVS